MGKPTGFLEYPRQAAPHRPVEQRVADWAETDLPLSEDDLARQAARCMDCGVPFCHGAGCPLASRVPEFNDLACRGRWRDAAEVLHATNNFPEVTGRICPAICEAACTLSINDQPVLIRQIELQIAERAFEEGWVVPLRPPRPTGGRVAIVGSGPAGLAAAQQLARAGHQVVVFEKDPAVGGLLRYGIPDFKLDKRVLDRRLAQIAQEGVDFQTGVGVGEDLSGRYLRGRFDAVLLAVGARRPRDLPVPGRELRGIHLAMDFLTRSNRLSRGEPVAPAGDMDARGKVVAVIGGGDTGSDCVGTARRQGAREIHQLEILPKPPEAANPATPWPAWPNILRTSTSHEEGCIRRWSVLTRRFTGPGGAVRELHGCEVDWHPGPAGPAAWKMTERPGTDFAMAVDMVILAMGFVHVEHAGLIEQLGCGLDPAGNLAVNAAGMTNEEGVFAAGDAAAGASLVVRAIASGRSAAAAITAWLRRR